MRWYTWLSLGSTAWFFMKPPNASASEALPVPKVDALPKGSPKPAVKPAPASTQPTTKIVTVGDRNYTVTRATKGVYQVSLVSEPTVFQDFNQTGVLRESGDPVKLAQLKLDEQQFPAGLFQS